MIDGKVEIEIGKSYQRTFTLGDVRQEGDAKDRTLRFIGTDETPDRYNTIFLVDGWRLENFTKNPVFLWAHNMDSAVPSLPIGRAIRIEKTMNAQRSTGGKIVERKALAFYVQFADEKTYPFADLVYRMYQKGFLSAVSVGFKTLKQRLVEKPEELAELGFQEAYGRILEENELAELSAVPVPGNPNALKSEIAALVPAGVRAMCVATEKERNDEVWLGEAFEKLRAALIPPAPVIVEPATAAAPVLDVRPAHEEKVEKKIKKGKRADGEVVAADLREIAETLMELADMVEGGEGESGDEVVAEPGKVAAPKSSLREVLAKLFAETMLPKLNEIFDALPKRDDMGAILKRLDGVEKAVRDGSVRVVGGEKPPVTAPANHVDALLGENLDWLRRIHALLPK